MNLGTAQIIQGNALNLPLPNNTVDLICTSPPYFGLRSYQDAGVHYDGQIGSESTPAEFLEALLAATQEMVRVLKPSGSIFVNLGDKYNSAASGQKGTLSDTHVDGKWRHDYRINERGRTNANVPVKSLMGLPWRYAIRCIDQLGLILRAEIIWAKPNGLPESVTDRVRRSHEQWFHFTVQPRYFSAVDEIRETYAPSSFGREKHAMNSAMRGRAQMPGRMEENGYTPGWEPSQLGKLPGSVWTIPTQPLEVPPELGVDHFAAYPMEWPRRIIQGWTPTGICTECGEGRRPLTDRTPMVIAPSARRLEAQANGNASRTSTSGTMLAPASATITGYVCACGNEEATPPGSETSSEWFRKSVVSATMLPPTRPAVVLDPFGGTGTTALVAKALGRNSIGVDLSADYCRLAQWRINNPGQLAAALQVEKPDVIPADQLSLFEDGMP